MADLEEGALAEIIRETMFKRVKDGSLKSILCKDFESFIKHLCAADVGTLCAYILRIDYNMEWDLGKQIYIENVLFSVIGKPWCVREEERILNSYMG